MDIPKDLESWVRKLNAERLTEEREECEKEKARRLAEKMTRERRLKDGFLYARFIFEWAREFRTQKTGKRIIKLCERTHLNGIMFFDDHLRGQPFRGLGVSAKGMWWIRNGCGAYPQPVNSPEELAQEIETEILARACKNIKNGRVWKCIRNRWELTKNQ